MNLETKEIAKISTVKIIGDVQTHLHYLQNLVNLRGVGV